MNLYYSKGACSLGVRITLHELNVSCEFESVDLKTKQTATGKNFLSINPKGAVPVLILDNNEVLTENVSILQYLAESYKGTQLLPPTNDFNHYRVLEWLSYISSDIHKSCGPLFNNDVPEKDKQEIFVPLLKNKLSFIEKHLQNNLYLNGNEYRLPDAYLFVVLRWLPVFKIQLSDFPNLSRYFNNMKERDSVKKALVEEGIA